VLHLTDHEDRGAQDARGARHVDGPQRQHGIDTGRTERGGDRDREQDRREGHHRVHQPHQQIVEAAEIAGEQADDRARERGDRDGRQADPQRQPRAEHHAGEHVAAEMVGAEQVLRRRRLEGVAHARADWAVAGEPVGAQRHA
jgi:hypothetical protein